jgi:hypothetical protein
MQITKRQLEAIYAQWLKKALDAREDLNEDNFWAGAFSLGEFIKKEIGYFEAEGQ